MEARLRLKMIFNLCLISLSLKAQASNVLQEKFIVAIIDTGVDTSNPLIKDKLWINSREIPGNNIDDDHNGFVDDINGWNFVERSNRVRDFDGHGTHIASIIARKSQKNSLMILKYYQEKMDPKQNLLNCMLAFRYAINNGANVINFSGGGYGESAEEKIILTEAAAKGILIIAAAGNDHINNDLMPYFPASYRLPNIVSVGSLTASGNISKFSNYGDSSVHLYAPGEDIAGFGVFGDKLTMSGTSQATAMVSGSIAEIAAKNQTENQTELGDMQALLGKVLVTRTQDKQINIAQIDHLKDNSQTALGIKLQQDQYSIHNSKQWIFNTH